MNECKTDCILSPEEFARHAAALRRHFVAESPKALKNPNPCLKHPFVDPGSVYDGNLWDWDSFWSVYALLGMTGRAPVPNAPDIASPAWRERILLHAKGNIANFFDWQLPDGYIPMMVEMSDLPEPYLIGKHREGAVLNMMKPFLCHQISLIGHFSGDFEWMRAWLPNLMRYFECYDRHYFQPNSGLYAWADDVMIGMDNDPASFGRPRFSTANIFLNSFMVRELRAMASICRALGADADTGTGRGADTGTGRGADTGTGRGADAGTEQPEGLRPTDAAPSLAERFEAKAAALVDAIQAECWDRRDRFFYSVDVDIRTRAYDWFHVGLGVFWKTLPIKIRAWSGFLPMWAGFATKEQAEALVRRHIGDEETFASGYGIRSLSRDEKMYDLSATNNPSNWLGPIWLIVNYMVFRGLMNYGFRAEAKRLLDQTVLLLGRDLERTGTVHEYYSPETGEPVMNGGFLNWNMLVLNMLDEWDGLPSMDALLTP